MLAAHLWLSFQHWPKSPKGPKTSQEGTLNEKGSEKIQKNIDKRIPKKSLRFRRSKITIVRKISLISLALAPLRLLELFRRCFGQGLLAVGLHSTCITVSLDSIRRYESLCRHTIQEHLNTSSERQNSTMRSDGPTLKQLFWTWKFWKGLYPDNIANDEFC